MEQIFLKILNMSITAGYCALAVIVLRLLLKKQPKIYSYTLWLIVAFRLLCPVSFESVFSLMRMPTEAVSVNIAVQDDFEEASDGVNRVEVNGNTDRKATIVAAPSMGDTTSDAMANAEAVEAKEENVTSPMQIALFAGSILWIVVAAVFLGYGIGSYMRMRRELSDAVETQPGIFSSDRLKTPFVLGHFKPQIYLPTGLTLAEKTYVVEHERTHIRRGDHIIKLAAFFLMCVHWFNPVLWVSFFLMCKDMEMSCDERVIKKLSGGQTLEVKKDYASTLLALASNHQFSFGGPLAFGEGNIKKRISNVLQYKKRTVVVSVGLAAIVIVAALLFIGNPKKEWKPAIYSSDITPMATATPTPTQGADTTATPVVTTNAVPMTPVPEATGVPKVTATPTPTPDTAKMSQLWIGDTRKKTYRKFYYGIVRENIIGNQFFSLELPAECVNKVSYVLEVEVLENGSEIIQAMHFYMTRLFDERNELMQLAMNSMLTDTVYWLESYIWVELEEYLEKENFGNFELEKQEFVLVNENGTGGMVKCFPLDNTFSGEEAETYQELGGMISNDVKLTFHKLPQTSYTERELKKYSDWQQESLGKQILENVYYAEIRGRQVITPYFELWVPEDCVDKVSYLLKIKEEKDGTKVVSAIQFFYAAQTEPREVFLTEPVAWSDYFVKSSWLGGIDWATVEEYDVPDTTLVEWVDRTGSVSIRKLEPVYQSEAAPFGRDFVWTNAEETAAYFYYLPTDVQFESDFEAEYLRLETMMKENSYITFFSEPDAISREAYIKKLKGFITE